MKKSILIIAVMAMSFVSFSQTLFSFGKQVVTKEEFMQIFLKNNNNLVGDKKKALQENLDLYIKYKLKVQAAYDYKYDTLPNQKEDLDLFKKQIEGKYLTEDKVMKDLQEEAFVRLQKDRRVSHITILFKKGVATTKEDVLKKITEAYNKLKSGIDFAIVAKQFSEDTEVQNNNGDLGYITAFSLPYTMENVAYTTMVNKYSAPFESSIGYHIFKVTADRNALGTMKGAQILFPFIPNSTPEQQAIQEKKANDIYTQLKKGENFENAARAYSGDVQSASGGGVLKDFTVGKYDAVFENTFAQLKDDEISKPFKTNFGWHILKRFSSTPIKKIKDAELTAQLGTLINNDTRKEKAQEVFIQKILKTCGYVDGGVNKNDLFAITQQKYNDKPVTFNSIDDKILLHSFTKQKVTVGNFWQFIKDGKSANAFKNTEPQNLLKEYVKATVLEYYKSHLEEFNMDYKNQIKEFKDGNLLFETMERQVWNKSSADSVGLIKYYNANANKYVWERSADALIISVSDKNSAADLYKSINKNATEWKSAVEKLLNVAQADTGRFELGNLPVAERTAFTNGMTSMPFSPNNDGNMVFIHIFKIYEAGAKKSFVDAKGLVINDYQIKLEEDWIANLKNKYPVKINDKIWNEILGK
jgi:peptidyl-prolyl cis-trans isomerase SurA